MILNNKTAKKLKKDFPIFNNNKNLVYLDNAATSQRPKQVINAVVDFYEKENANPGRSLHALAEKSMQKYNEARKIVAGFLNSKSEEIIFTRNATESLNLAAHIVGSLIPNGKDEILLTEMEHHSNLVPWQQLAKSRGFNLKFVKIKSDFTLDMNDLKEKLTDKTAVFAFAYVSNVLGSINDVKLLNKIAKSKGAITVIDAAQAVQHIKIDVKKIGCDFLAFSSHKMLGPMGIGVLYGKKELLEKAEPNIFGGGMIKKVDWKDSSWHKIPEKFEAGTQNIAGSIGLVESIKYLENMGFENISKWEKELLEYGLKKMKEVPDIKIFNPGLEKSSAIISFSLSKIHPHDVAELLNRVGIAIRAGHQCAMPLMSALELPGGLCRVSFSIYNTFEDIDKLVRELKKIVEKFS